MGKIEKNHEPTVLSVRFKQLLVGEGNSFVSLALAIALWLVVMVEKYFVLKKSEMSEL